MVKINPELLIGLISNNYFNLEWTHLCVLWSRQVTPEKVQRHLKHCGAELIEGLDLVFAHCFFSPGGEAFMNEGDAVSRVIQSDSY